MILAGAIFIWILASFPQSKEIQEHYEQEIENLATLHIDETQLQDMEKHYKNQMLEEQLEYSFAGRLGHFLQPFFAPLGFDWRLSVALITGFSAKEMVVTTLGVLYALGDQATDDEEENLALQEILQKQHS